MAICGSRMESIVTVEAKTGGVRTGLVWWMNDGVASKESKDQVSASNASTKNLGDALAANGDRTLARVPSKALNTRQDATGA